MIDKELVVRIPHELGAAEAQRRLSGGLDAAIAQYGRFLGATEAKWAANRLNFRIAPLGQSVQGSLAVEEEFVELKAQLPWMIRLLAKRFLPAVQDTGHKLLK